jgi:lipopolysaccharide transport system ATP-binding protein
VPVISVRNVTKRFRRRGARRAGTLKRYVLGAWRAAPAAADGPEYTWALRDVSLTVERGTTVGIIGRNGSGKSTLLRIVGGILKPDAGEVTVEGQTSTLIELGAGFHPDLTGRENVLVNGLVLGLSKREIRERFTEIVDFAELAEYIDEPVRTYSTGMYMRLGFSVAMHTNPDVILIDEGLAVGDFAFVRKCVDRLDRFKKEGKTIVVVTHEMNTVKHWCDEGIWLHEGRVMAAGDPDDVVNAYTRLVS